VLPVWRDSVEPGAWRALAVAVHGAAPMDKTDELLQRANS
jgi:hypothetical protein